MSVIVISGAARGLGAALNRRAQAAGWQTLGLDVHPASDCSAHAIVDVGDHVSVTAAVSDGAAQLGGIDAVVTCAGMDVPGALEGITAEEWQRVISVNLIGTVNVVRAALSHFPERGGRIATVASTLGLKAASEATAYCASKFGVVGFTRSLAAELQATHAVALVIPGGMQTSFFDDREDRFKPGPDADLADPEDVADLILQALEQPVTCAVRELVITPMAEPSWP
jgi:NAD(P)-dependent dehydrogenase (short-subunit alcohol dehydrogenase family)